ncbi:MAG TPA: Na+:solute symporter, partial [Gemmatimonadales bacterium]|nr:Na+:solute symporter [Gemmatimonadales bacterium]
GSLLFNVAHYALRSWPWILTALASLLVYPTLDDIARTFPHVDPALLGHDMAYPAMLRFLPHGMLGVMIAAMLAAYVSTISTHLNWGSSYLVIDFYQRFVRPGASERHYIAVGRLVTALLMVVAALLTLVLDSARQAFQLMLSVGAGTGLLYLLRWYWWRVNAWSEIAAMVSSFLVAVGFFVADRSGHGVPPHVALLLSVAVTSVVWIGVTWLTSPTDMPALVRFYELVRPAGPGWRPVQSQTDVGPSADSLPQAMLGWLLGCTFVYAALFGVGSALYGRTGPATLWGIVALVSGAGLARLMPRMWRSEGG